MAVPAMHAWARRPCYDKNVRRLIDSDPFQDPKERNVWNDRGRWPARWIAPPQAIEPPFVTAYRLRFTMTEEKTVRIHVSADERYDLWLDGQRIGRGPECGAGDGWESPMVRDTGINAEAAYNYEPTPLLRPAMLPAMMSQPRKVGRVRHVGAVESSQMHLIAADESTDARWQDLIEGKGE